LEEKTMAEEPKKETAPAPAKKVNHEKVCVADRNAKKK